MVDQRGTVTTAEHAALKYLADGPAVLGPRTGTIRRRPLPPLYDTPNATVAAAKLADAVTTPARLQEAVRVIESKAARRLAARGLVDIDDGGTVTLRVEP